MYLYNVIVLRNKFPLITTPNNNDENGLIVDALFKCKNLMGVNASYFLSNSQFQVTFRKQVLQSKLAHWME